MGAADQSLDAAVAGSLFARGVDRRLPGGACRSPGKDARNLSPAVIARLSGGVAGRLRRLASARSLGAAITFMGRTGSTCRRGSEDAAECMLVLIGATPEGKKELVGFQTGVRESAQSWRELLIDIKQRGLHRSPRPRGRRRALGFWKAIEQVFPQHPTSKVLGP